MVADIDGELELRRMGMGQVQRMSDGGAAKPTATGGRSQAKVDHFPDVPIGDVGEQKHHGCIGLARYLAKPPAMGDEPPGGAMPRDDVVQRPDSLQLGHIQA